MIRIIDKFNMHLYPKTMDQQYRLRHSVFVDEKGWKQFERDGIYEKDPYDTEDATYAVVLNDDGDAIGCFRAYPTMLPHMLSETFPNMVDGSLIRRQDVFEISRFHLSKAARDSGPWIELVTGIQEVGLTLGLSGFTGITRTLRLPVMQSVGINVRPLGLPVFFDGESNVSVFIEVSEESLARLHKKRGSTASVLEQNYDRRISA